eukprot:gnl/MRDRNA2_/MRDRNA2_151373_c0_seq1.p1 gnl/MRDRNA2_/MRDRNA2_151373_c0~~gnl/MRDRNA2_/MRDRNA2_151373_c0_seq1.p1  ORF type:complete len:150 (+),score=25.62 gnl/MRDRNA2_/MRDRNA2_151373_c0_seq1:135-584(+)
MESWALVLLLIVLVAGILLFFYKLSGLSELSRSVEQQQQHANGIVPTVIGAARYQSQIDLCFPVMATCTSSQCAICMEICANAPCRQLQCGHVFHADCILRWWMRGDYRQLQCPVCRQQQNIEIPVSNQAASPITTMVLVHEADEEGSA